MRHRGVIGILASRVVDRTRRPALVLTSEDGGCARWPRAARSTGYHLLDALTAVNSRRRTGAIVYCRFGAALTLLASLPTDRLPLLRERMRAQSSDALTAEMLLRHIECDLELEPSDLTMDLIQWLGRCAPFGMGNPEPVFVTRGLRISAAPRIIKEKHLSLPLGKSADNRSLTAMGWSRSGQTSWAERCDQNHLTAGSRIDIVYRLRENQHPIYGGIELELIDLMSGKE